jgi:exopolysaccharide production protein ExoZ
MGRERILSVQALRFFAAAMVVFNHSAELAVASTGQYGPLATHNLSYLGAAGVDIFFVISGLVITLTGPLAEPRPTGIRFLWNRWSRVAPMFLLLTIPTLMFFWVKGPMSPYGAGGPMNAPQNWATLAFWPASTELIVPPYLSQGWTLTFEMIFYSAVAFVLAGGKLRRNLAIITVVGACIVWARWYYEAAELRVLANRTYIEFGYGVLLAFLLPRLRRAPISLIAPLLLTAAAFYTWAAVVNDGGSGAWRATLSDEHTEWRVFLFGTPAVCIVATAIICERDFRGRLAGILTYLGDASYSIYLTHALVLLGLWSLWRVTGAPPSALVVLIGLVAGTLGGIVVHETLEKPVMRIVRRVPVLVHHAASQIGRAKGARGSDVGAVVDELKV